MIQLDLQWFAKGGSGDGSIAADRNYQQNVTKQQYYQQYGSGSAGGSGGGGGNANTARSSASKYVSRTEIVKTETYELIRDRNGRDIPEGSITGAELLNQGYTYNPNDKIWRNRSGNRYKVKQK